ncbi:helix-turn-helix domain-containing protein [Euzebya pacifica]|uniref:helix-turn-helix domain-containing protein n=1 Tax=Euzebya pacifica TaxID=1608957 RepID=UPI0030F76D14
MSESLLDVDGAAQRLGVSIRWVRRAVAERRVPFVKVGRHVRFREDDLSDYIERQTVPAVEVR